MGVKINSLEIENVKRVKAVKIEPNESGLTVIGGNNNQGKSSVLDAIAWALGGDRFKPSQSYREGSSNPPNLHIELSNGLIVERKGKNSDLKVIDPTGRKSGQQLLNEFISSLALDLPKFMQSSAKEKANTLLQIIGLGDVIFELEQKEDEAYNRRHAIGQIAEQKQKYADELIIYPEVPDEPVSVSELIKEQQDILARNGEKQRLRMKSAQLKQDYLDMDAHISALKKELETLIEEQKTLEKILNDSLKSSENLEDESTEELEASLRAIEEINIKVRSNMDKKNALIEANKYKDMYDELTEEIKTLRQKKVALLNGAELPLPELSVDHGELLYKGFKWDSMSGSEQLRVATAIVRKLNPNCGFVLLDKLEQMDLTTLSEFGKWLESEGLQAIATRVSTGNECSIVIEDGYSIDNATQTQFSAFGRYKQGGNLNV